MTPTMSIASQHLQCDVEMSEVEYAQLSAASMVAANLESSTYRKAAELRPFFLTFEFTCAQVAGHCEFPLTFR